MHDLLQQMGRDIVQQESLDLLGERNRLWCYEDVHKVLTQNTVCIILVHFLPFFQMANVVIIFHLNVEENLSLLVYFLFKFNCHYTFSEFYCIV